MNRDYGDRTVIVEDEKGIRTYRYDKLDCHLVSSTQPFAALSRVLPDALLANLRDNGADCLMDDGLSYVGDSEENHLTYCGKGNPGSDVACNPDCDLRGSGPDSRSDRGEDSRSNSGRGSSADCARDYSGDD